MTRRFWLSFVDSARPPGQQFLGVSVVEVTDDDAEAMKEQVDRQFPNHQPGAEWIAAATSAAWRYRCNPGGEVGAVDLTEVPVPAGVEVPLNRLMQKEELRARGLCA